jgi:hypothetical protein
MVFGDIVDHQTNVLKEKTVNFRALVPAGLVYPKINQIPPVSAQDGLEHREESIGIPLGLSDHTVLARHRVDPPEYIHPFMILAPRPDHRLLPSFRPYSPEFGMEAETGFIRKQDQSLPPTSAKAEEFFLMSAETPSRLLPWLEHTGRSADATKTLIAESTVGPASPADAPRGPASDTQPQPPRPTGSASSPMTEHSSVKLRLRLVGPRYPSEEDAQAAAPLAPPQPPGHLSSEPTSPHSTGSRLITDLKPSKKGKSFPCRECNLYSESRRRLAELVIQGGRNQ